MTLHFATLTRTLVILRPNAAFPLLRFPLTPVQRTLFTRRTFPARTRRFLDMQETLRVRSGLPRGVELVYLLPPYRSSMVKFVDCFSVVGTVVGAAAIVTYVVWRRFFANTDAEEKVPNETTPSKTSDDNVSDNSEYVVDQRGERWKKSKIQLRMPSTDILSNQFVSLQLLFSIVGFFIVLRVDCARTPLRIFYHPASRHYHAIFSRHFQKERLSSFPASRVLWRHKAFRIVTAEGSDVTLPNKVMPRHFKDEESCRVFSKKKFV